jgi:hypothetical protein
MVMLWLLISAAVLVLTTKLALLLATVSTVSGFVLVLGQGLSWKLQCNDYP